MRKNIWELTLVAAAACTLAIGGCNSTKSLMRMSAEHAWIKARDDAANGSMVGNALGGFFGETMAEYIKRQQDMLADAVKDASTPNIAVQDMVKEVSSYLMETLPAHARNAGVDQHRLNLGMGQMANRDNDPALRQALKLIRNELVNNSEFTNQFRILSSSKEDAREILEDLRSSLSNRALFDPDGSGGDMGSYNPKDLYIVGGEIYLRREGTEHNRLIITTTVTTSHPYSGELVGSHVFSKTYHFHPAEQRFITDFEDKHRPIK